MGGGDGVHAKPQARSSDHGAVGEWLDAQPAASVRALFSDDVRAATAAVIMADAAKSVDKIRDVVEFRRIDGVGI